jgi:glycosyltransferase involved in cell wall biosynthesis
VTARRLKICLISEEFPPDTGWGGIGSYSRDVARGLIQLGHRVHVVARGWGDEKTIEDIDGVQVHRVTVPEPSWRGGSWLVNMRFPESRQVLVWSAQASRAVAKIQAIEGLDVIESPEYHAQGLVSSIRHRATPMVVRLHTPAFVCRKVNGISSAANRCDTLLSERAENWAALRAALLTSPSRALANDVAKGWQIPASGMRIIPNPIDEERFRPNGSSQQPTVLFVGRLERRKGVETLITAWPSIRAAIPEARAKLVGADHASGPDGSSMKAHLQGILKTHGIVDDSVSFTPQVDRSALPEVYGSSQLCVIPSLYENFPYTCLEAMACGCAVVASRVGGIPEILENGASGILIAPNDPTALAEAVVRLLRSTSLREKLATAARETIEQKFSRRVVCAQMANAYAELVG